MAKRPTQTTPVVDAVAKDLRTQDLLLDPENPRLRDAGLSANPTQDQITKALWDQMAVDEVALSIAKNGFFRHEPLYAEKQGNTLYVIEGNRRLAAVKLLRDPELAARLDIKSLPEITEQRREELATLPVVVCPRDQIWTFLGFKHINGPQSWESYAKAHYVAWVHNNLRVSLDEIADRIGDKHSTVGRFYDALMVLDQAEQAGIFDREDRHKNHFSFSHLTTGLGYANIRKFLGLPVGERTIGKQKPVPKKHEKELGELLVWLYGKRSEDIRPVVESQNPDLRRLDEVLGAETSTIALRKGLPLPVALDISKGDDRVLRESLIAAKQALQKARGTVVTAYKGQGELLEMAADISTLAQTLLNDMESLPTKRPRKKN